MQSAADTMQCAADTGKPRCASKRTSSTQLGGRCTTHCLLCGAQYSYAEVAPSSSNTTSRHRQPWGKYPRLGPYENFWEPYR